MKTSEEYISSIKRLNEALISSDAVVLGAGAGLSTSAGYIYTGERFDRYFFDFTERYRFKDMYSGGFYVLDLLPEIMWAYWSRYIWINRYAPIPSDIYSRLYDLIRTKDYFVITTNVDHCFQRSGFDKERLFYTQGDYGLFQSSKPSGASAGKTYDNEGIIRQMVLSQGFAIGDDNELIIPDRSRIKMWIPSDLIPICPDDGNPMTMNLRSDDLFVEDEGWHKAADRYSDFLKSHKEKNILFLELAVGYNTPAIIKFSFWNMTKNWRFATYACLNYGDAYAPEEISDRSVIINGDIGDILDDLKAFSS